ncbi:MAG: zf-HC2 domain-containing protein [bacterium]
MDCKAAQKLLSSYMDKKVSEKEKDLLELHLRECKTCQEFFEEFKKTISMVESLGEMEVPTDFIEEIEREIKNVPRRKSFAERPLWFRMPVEALGTVLAVVIIFVLGSLFIRGKAPAPGDVSLQKDDKISSRWMPDERVRALPGGAKNLSSTPEQADELYGVVNKIREAYSDMGVSFSEEEADKKQMEREKKAEEKAIVDSFKQPTPPSSWSKTKEAPAKRAGKVTAFQQEPSEIMRRYNITMKVDDLSGGMNELIQQVHSHGGKFITSPETAALAAKTTGKNLMLFNIPKDDYYKFIWNIEKVGSIEKIVPSGGRVFTGDKFVTVELTMEAKK